MEGAPPIWVTTDGCLTGGGGYVSQGEDPNSADVVGFWSGKWNSAQQNYPVHEQELLALVETLKRFRGILHGTKFTVRTDHKGLIHLKTQRDLSPRQHRWLDVINEFDFNIEYIPGDTNKFTDALSRIYSDEPEGVVRADSEHVNDTDEPIRRRILRAHPIYVDAALISIMSAEVRRSSRLAGKPGVNYKDTREKKPKKEMEDESPTMVQEFPDEVESGSESDETTIEEENRDVRNVEKLLEETQKLFETIENVDASFPNCLKGRYEEDPGYKPILDNPENFTNFEIKDNLVFFKSEGVTRLAIPNVKIDGRSIRETVIRQAHTILAHLGGQKTLTYLRDQVWWRTMVQDINDYCKSCPTCATSKSSTEKPRGLLKTMPVPTHPWQYIGVDFVGPLPESSNRNGAYDMICVIIDLLTAMVHLVPTRQNYKAADMAEVIFDTVYKLHGLPERIISDRDSLFTSHFWKKLHALLNIELRLSSSFHPQTDGATERANKTMTQMLRQCVSLKQKDWVTKLPAIEFAMNSARSSTTGFTPFFLNYGRNPSPMIWKGEEVYPGVRQFAEKMKNAIMSAHDTIIASRVQQTNQANRKRLPATYKEGDLVYLSTKNISMPKGRARKLAPKYLGPFPISRVIKEGATYQLELSDELTKRGVNRAFHASLLRPHVPNDDRRFPGRMPIQIPGFGEKPEEWIVDRIVTHHGKGMGSEFQILWKAGDMTWASYREVAHLNALDRYCELMGVRDASELPPNYISMDSEDEEDNKANIIMNACTIEGTYKTKSKTTIESIDHSTNALYSNMIYSSLSPNEVRDCLEHERHLSAARLGVGAPPRDPPPKWEEFQSEQAALTPRNQTSYPQYQRPQSFATDNVSMPADTLEAIICAIGNATRPTPPVAPRIVTKYVPRPRPPPTPVVHRGRGGGFSGRGRGQSNRRGRRSEPTTRDPRRNNVNGTFTSASTSNAPTTGPNAPSNIPINTDIATNDTDITSVDSDDISFFSEFTNTDIGSGGENDVIMNGDNGEGNFIV